MSGQIEPFELEGVAPSGEIRTYTLSELTDDAALVIGVYVYDYSPVCETQVCDMDNLEWLTFTDSINTVGISGDGPYAHQKFSRDNEIGYPLLSDTAEEVIEDLGVIQEEQDGLRRVPRRSLFVIDQDRRIRWQWIADDNWDDWDSAPISELHEAVTSLPAIS